MTSILLSNPDNINESLISYCDVENTYYNTYDTVFSYDNSYQKKAHILDIEYNKNKDINTVLQKKIKPYNIWSLRSVGSSLTGENVSDTNVRKSYKIASHINEYDNNNYNTPKNIDDEFYVYLYNAKNDSLYYKDEFCNSNINIKLLPSFLQNQLNQFNDYLIDNFGNFYKDEAKYNFIHFDYSKQMRGNFTSNCLRKWKVHKYEKGCFFKAHTDTKKNELHIGTLVLVPPENYSQYTGGNLIIYDTVDVDKQLLNIRPTTGWQCIFIKIDQKHEILEVTSGTRYSFTSPFCISQTTIDNMTNNTYCDVIPEEKVSKLAKQAREREIKDDIESIEKQIKKLMEKKDDLLKIVEDSTETFTLKYNEIINLDPIKNRNPFIVICEGFYTNPTPDNLNACDLLIYNSIITKFDDGEKKPELRFINTKLSIDSGTSNEEVYDDYSDNDGDGEKEFWGYNKENRYYDVNDKLKFDRYMLNERMFGELKQYKIKTNYGQYDNYMCYYHSDKSPGSYLETESEYNDNYYENQNHYNVTCIIVNFD